MSPRTATARLFVPFPAPAATSDLSVASAASMEAGEAL